MTRETQSTIEAALSMVRDEIRFARAKHPGRTIDCQPNRDTRLRIVAEEVGEVAAECQNVSDSNGAAARRLHRERLAHELAQVVACSLMWLADEIATLNVADVRDGVGQHVAGKETP